MTIKPLEEWVQSLLKEFLTEAGAFPQLPTQPNFFFDHFQNYTAFNYGHSELPLEEKSKFEFEESSVYY